MPGSSSGGNKQRRRQQYRLRHAHRLQRHCSPGISQRPSCISVLSLFWVFLNLQGVARVGAGYKLAQQAGSSIAVVDGGSDEQEGRAHQSQLMGMPNLRSKGHTRSAMCWEMEEPRVVSMSELQSA